MYDNSVITRTGQWYKVLLYITSAVVGVIFFIYGAHWVRGSATIGWVAAGILLEILGVVYAYAAIRCPACGARWLWLKYVNKDDECGLLRLLKRDDCPICKKKFYVEVI